MRPKTLVSVVVVGFLALAGAACERSREVLEVNACETFCECRGDTLPAARDRCVGLCVEDVTPMVSDACLECLADTTCTTVERDCGAVCGFGP